jgi:alpha-methylacyl-CoA racemase
MSDASAYIITIVYSMLGAGIWRNQREANILDGGAPWCAIYQCKDDQWVAISPDEPKFFALLLDKLGLSGALTHEQYDPAGWDEMRSHFKRTFLTRTRQEWCDLLEGTDTCFAPVLSPLEAPSHAHNRARGTFLEVDGAVQPAPVPLFSVTPAKISAPPPKRGEHTFEVLEEWSVKEEVIDALRQANQF